MKILLIILFLLSATGSFAAEFDVSGMGSNSWLKNTTMPFTNRKSCVNFVNCGVTISRTTPAGRSFSGPAFGNGMMFFMGGGHASYAGNDIELWRRSDNTWRQQYDPEGLNSGCAIAGGDGSNPTHPSCNISAGGRTATLTPLGRSYVEHTYQTAVYDPNRDYFMFGMDSGLWAFDPNAPTPNMIKLGSAQHPFNQQSDLYRLMIYDPTLQTVVAFPLASIRKAHRFNWSDYTWTVGSTFIPCTSDGTATGANGICNTEVTSAYDTVRKKHLVVSLGGGGSNGPVYSYDAVTDIWTLISNTPAGALGSRSVSYDEANNKFLVATLNGSNLDLYTYDPTTGTPGTWAGPFGLTGTRPVKAAFGALGSWGVLHYDRERQVHLLINQNSIQTCDGCGGSLEGDFEMWAYRLNKVGTTRQVGSARALTTAAAAAAVATDWDRIEFDPGTYALNCTVWTPSNMTIVGVSTRPVIDAQACAAGPGQGTWIFNGNNNTVDNFEFKNGSRGDSERAIGLNGQGINIRNSYFHDNDVGVLAGGPTPGRVLIEYSQFYNNGDLFCAGQEHNMYIGEVDTFVLRYSYSRQANCGHLVKTRALNNYILYNRLTDESDSTSGGGDTSSNALDIPQGGRSYVIGNIFRKGDCSDGGDMLNFNEGYLNGENQNALQELYVLNNTFNSGVSTGACNNLSSIRFIRVRGTAHAATVQIKNNIFFGQTGIPHQVILDQTSGAGIATVSSANNLCRNLSDTTHCAPGLTNSDPLFTNAAAFDYTLQATSPAINAGSTLTTYLAGYSPIPDFTYVQTASKAARPLTGIIDIGAFEGSGGVSPPSNTRITRAQ